MPLAKLRAKAQITLPKEVVTTLDLSAGDMFNIVVKSGKIIMEPQAVIPKDEAGFYTPESQASFKRALDDVEKGHTHGPFNNADELVNSLNS